VGNDNTVVFHKVRQYHDGSHAIFRVPRCLAATTRTVRCGLRRWTRRHDAQRGSSLHQQRKRRHKSVCDAVSRCKPVEHGVA
jgi:hypothetical protein